MPLSLNETWLHFNERIWQVPSVGIAIAGAAVYAANDIAGNALLDGQSHPASGAILLFGAVLVAALSAALFKYRAYQAACSPADAPFPIGRSPRANSWLQNSLGLTGGMLLGLAGVSYVPAGGLPVVGVAMLAGLACSMAANFRGDRVLQEFISGRGPHAATYRTNTVVGRVAERLVRDGSTGNVTKRGRKALIIGVLFFMAGVLLGSIVGATFSEMLKGWWTAVWTGWTGNRVP